jgi:tetratricopeptide (TPR) repeat protein
MSNKESTFTLQARPNLETALATLETTAAALENGQAPRQRKPLRDAIAAFRRAGRMTEATRGLQLLAELEYRRGDVDRALTAARAAYRLARQTGSEEALDAALDLLARFCAAAGHLGKAREHAAERVRYATERRDRPQMVEALSRLAQVAWQAEDVDTAVRAAESALVQASESGEPQARAKAQRALGLLLLGTGCAHAAGEQFTQALKLHQAPEDRVRLLLARGSGFMCCGSFDSAARDFRRAIREAKTQSDRRLEVEATAALAAAEAALAEAQGNGPRKLRAAKLADRAARRSRRLRDAELEWKVVFARQATARGGALADGAPLPGTPREAADALVALAYRLDSITMVDACYREVEWLATLEQQERPYRCDFRLPFLP